MTIEQQPSAVTLGQTLKVTINDLAFGGEGVARVNDFVLFIPYVIPGETVEVEVIEVKKAFGRAKLISVITPSVDRATPECKHFGACGGCQYQHIAYPAQLAMKRKQIADIFQRIGGIAQDIVAPVVPCPRPYGYRNRIMIRSQWNKPEQRLNIGFVRADCGLVEDIFECKIAEPALNEQITHVRNNPPPKGGIKVVLRIAPKDWEVPRDSFFQNNFFLLPGLVDTVRSALTAAGTKHLVDLYCGVGFFGIALASAVESFVGVECDRMAITAARKNAAMKNATNGEFISANVEDALPNLVNKFSAAATSVLIDPPRKGCLPQTLQLLRDQRPAQIIYVSCNPATMARDLNILCADGVFTLAKVTPLDMFPQTQHVECVADLRAAVA
ncbi:MAG: class I SAM-dependent RNA methyltransferase [Verrucomicrobia bacterium]|nr:MAG: class I SAM-dependent RNA methyltransferase [Verrucomicrobiota bacterium]